MSELIQEPTPDIKVYVESGGEQSGERQIPNNDPKKNDKQTQSCPLISVVHHTPMFSFKHCSLGLKDAPFL